MIVTDKLKTYPRAIQAAFAGRADREVPFHLQKPRFVDPTNNNLVERLNGTIREREKILRGFKKQKTAQVIVDGFRVYYNLVRVHQTLQARPSDLALGVNVATNNRWLDLIRKAHAEQQIHP